MAFRIQTLTHAYFEAVDYSLNDVIFYYRSQKALFTNPHFPQLQIHIYNSTKRVTSILILGPEKNNKTYLFFSFFTIILVKLYR